MEQAWSLTLAGISLPFVCRFPDTPRYFSAQACTPDPGQRPVRILELDWQRYLAQGMEDCAHTEYSMFTPWFSDALLPYDRVILHAVALRWQDRAWLICAPSGVGKSTQAKHLQTLRPGEFGIICGDRPVLQFCHSSECGDEDCSSVSPVPPHPSEGSEASASPVQTSPASRGEGPASRPVEGCSSTAEILVHPSPWNGKEDWHGAAAAPLAGVILLERGEENCVEPLRPAVAVPSLYAQIVQTYWKEQNILTCAKLLERLLREVPTWRMVTHDVPASTRILLKTVFEPKNDH